MSGIRSLVIGMCCLGLVGAAACGGGQGQGTARPAPSGQNQMGAGGGSGDQSAGPSVPQIQAEIVPGFSLYAIIASKKTHLAHRRDCKWVRTIAAKDQDLFRTFGAAQAAGYKPCPVCSPDQP